MLTRRPSSRRESESSPWTAPWARESGARAAARFYEERWRSPVSFSDQRTRFLFHWNFALAAFRSGNVLLAADQFQTAIEELETLQREKIVTADRAKEIRLELVGRRALALMEAYHDDEAALLFEQVEQASPENSLARARAIRNQALLRQRLAERSSGTKRAQHLLNAEQTANRALAMLENNDLAPDAGYSRGGGLIDLEFVFTSDSAGGGAKLGFDRDDESRLVRAILGRIAQMRQDHSTALTNLQKQIDQEPAITDANKAYYLTARSVTLSRMTGEAMRANRPGDALDFSLRGLEISKFTIAGEVFIDSDAASRHLLGVLEAMLAMPDAPALNRPEALWMLEPADFTETAASPFNRMDRAARRLLFEDDPVDGQGTTLLVTQPREQARLHLVRALCLERITMDDLRDLGDTEGASLLTAGVRAVQAIQSANQVLRLSRNASQTPEAFRLAELSHASILRLTSLIGTPEEVDARLLEARDFARQTGQPFHQWWMIAQLALASSDPAATFNYADQTLVQLEQNVIFSRDGADPIPLRVYDLVEAAHLRSALESDAAPEMLWDISDRWRAVRLAHLAERSEPLPASPEDEQWLREHARLIADFREINADLHALPFDSSVRQELLERAANLHASIREHIDAGIAQALPSAEYLHPSALGFEAVGALLEPPFITGTAPLFLLNRELPGLNLRVLFKTDETVMLQDDVPLPTAERLFVFGERTEDLPANGVLILNSQSFFQKFEHLSFNLADRPASFPSHGATDGRLESETATELRLAYELDVTRGAEALGYHAPYWLIDETPVTLRELLAAATNLEEVALPLSLPEYLSRQDRQGRWLAAASLLDQHGIVEANLDGARWLGVALTPAEVPDIAASELAAVEGRFDAAKASGDSIVATTSLEKAILIKESLGQTEDLPLYYVELAEARTRIGRHKDASRAAARRVELLEESGDTTSRFFADALKWRADMADLAKEWDVAEETYQRVEALYAQLQANDALLDARRDHAIMMENAGHYREAFALAGEVREAAIGNDPELAINQAIRMARVARIYLNRYNDAERLLLAAHDEANAHNLPALQLEASLNLARVDEATARFEQAMRRLEEAELLADQLADELKQGEVVLERANVHWYRSEYFDSFREQDAALRVARNTGNLALEVATLNVSGLTAWAVNDLVRAHNQLERALERAEELGTEAEIASTANNIGLVFRSEKDYERATEWFRRALAIDDLQGNRWGQAYSLRNIGITMTSSGKAQDALEPLARAIELTTDIGDDVNLAKSLLARGDAHSQLGRTQDATSDYEAALEYAERIPLPEVHWRALYGLGLVNLKLNNNAEAEQVLAAAIEIVDQLRASIRIEEFQNGFLLDKQDLYNTMVTLQLDKGDIETAFETSEKARGRNFIDLLGNRRLNLHDQMDEEALAREQALRQQIESLEREVATAPETTAPGLRQQLDNARQDYSDFLIQLRADNPQLSSFVRVEPVSVQELQALLDLETRLFSYHVLPEELVLFVLGPNSLEHFRTPVNSELLSKLILDTRLAIQNFEPVETPLYQLSTYLTEPALASLSGVKRVGIIPHRQLHTLPFAALPAGTQGDLIDRVAIFYAPSASVLRYTIARRGERSTTGNALAVGNPAIGEAMNLPFAEKEAERLRFTFPQLELRTGSEATETWLVENLQNYAIVHIASHGEYSPEMPLFSAVLLAPDQQNDGALSAQEIFGLTVRADLVALSACQSGLGRVSNGDDIVGLSRSFVYAGTRQLLSTLWRVDDISTAVLFKHFYRNIDTTDRAEALRQAQIELKNRPEYVHPAHWSGLVLSGDWQ